MTKLRICHRNMFIELEICVLEILFVRVISLNFIIVGLAQVSGRR